MMIETKLPFDQQYVRSFSEGRGEPDWLLNVRLQALAQAEQLPLPKPDKTKSIVGTLHNFLLISLKALRFLL